MTHFQQNRMNKMRPLGIIRRKNFEYLSIIYYLPCLQDSNNILTFIIAKETPKPILLVISCHHVHKTTC